MWATASSGPVYSMRTAPFLTCTRRTPSMRPPLAPLPNACRFFGCQSALNLGSDAYLVVLGLAGTDDASLK